MRGDESSRARVFELMRKLDGLVHRVQADRDAACAQGAIVRDGELGRVLQEDRHAVARRNAAALQEAGEAAHRRIQLSARDRAPVEVDGGAIGDALRLPGERGGLELVGATDRLPVVGHGPLLLPYGFHGSSPAQGAGNPYTCVARTDREWMWRPESSSAMHSAPSGSGRCNEGRAVMKVVLAGLVLSGALAQPAFAGAVKSGDKAPDFPAL